MGKFFLNGKAPALITRRGLLQAAGASAAAGLIPPALADAAVGLAHLFHVSCR